MKMCYIAVCAASVVAMFAGSAALADTALELDASSITPLELLNTGANDAYSSGRGVIFTTNQPITLNGVELFTKAAAGLNATFELHELTTTTGSVLTGATLLRTTNAVLVGGLGFHGTSFPDITLPAGKSYLIRVAYTEPADQNWYFRYDQGTDPTINLGPVTVVDGTASGNSGNTVTPFMALRMTSAITRFKRKKGQDVAGDLDSLRVSDNDTRDLAAASAGRKFRTKAIVFLKSPCTGISRLDLRIETGANRGGITTKVQLFNFNTRKWTLIDTFTQTRSDKSRIYADLHNPNRFLSPGGGVKVQISSVHRSASYTLEHDQVEVIVTPR